MKKESEKPKVVLDTKPLIKMFAQEEGWDAVQRIFSRIEADEIEAGISVVTLTEIYYRYVQEKRLDLAEKRIGEFRYALYIKKLSVDEDVAIKAGEYKDKFSVSIADAFIAATAYFEGATVISDDPDFKKIPEIKTLTEMEFDASLNK